MNPDRWEKIQRVFNEVADAAPQQRQELLERECVDDPTLRFQVESLLAYDGNEMLERAVGLAAQEVTAAQAPAGARFQTIRVLGSGGMGVVYEAEQTNPRRRVALKVIRSGKFATDQQRRLLQREASALGRLQHPGIATIYESGMTEDGEPYLVMELVNGETLQSFLNRVAAPARINKDVAGERIQLFLSICDAIHYAHLHGVIHRDIKPGNIIIPADESGSTGSGSAAGISTQSGSSTRRPVKVLDFGLARVAEHDMSVTMPGVIQGSIPYMSPEQVRADRSKIDLRTDVYSLGVLLYEMLSGKHPYLDESVGLVAGAAMISGTAPKPFRSLNIPYDEDLETIAFKALEKDSARRYQSVLELSEDIQRYLQNLPIQARPPSSLYQLRKLYGRHKFVFASAGLLLLMLVAFSITATIQGQRIIKERDRANLEAESARQVAQFLTGLFKNTDPARAKKGSEITARELLALGQKRLAHDLKDQPEIRARLLDSIAAAYNSLLPYEEAVKAASESIAIRRKLYGPDSALEGASWNQVASAHYDLGHYKESAEASLHAAAISQRHAPDSEQLAEELSHAAQCYSNLGDEAKADELISRALGQQKRIGKTNTPGYASIADIQAQTMRRRGDFQGAIPLLRESFEIKRKAGGDGTDILTTMNELGLACNLGGDPAEGAAIYRDMLQRASRVFGPDHPNIAILRLNLAASLNLLGQHAEAEKSVRAGLARFEKTGLLHHPTMADFHWALAESLDGQGRLEEADPHYREALDRYVKDVGPREYRTANSYHQLARHEVRMGKAEEGLAHARTSMAIIEQLKRTETTAYAMAQLAAGKALEALSRDGEARPYLERAHAKLLRLLGPNRPETRFAGASISGILKRPDPR